MRARGRNHLEQIFQPLAHRVLILPCDLKACSELLHLPKAQMTLWVGKLWLSSVAEQPCCTGRDFRSGADPAHQQGFFGPRASWDGLFTFCRALCTKMQRNFLVSRYCPGKLERLSLNCVQGKTRLTTTQQGWMSLAAINYYQSFIHRSVWEAFRGSIPQSLCKLLLIWHKKMRVISLCLEWAGRTWIKPHSQESMCLFWRTHYFLLVQFNHSFPSRSLYYFWEEIDWWRGSLLLTYFTEETRISGYCMLANHFWI